jgi:DNA end-binding protein Ku
MSAVAESTEAEARALWSGTITFGLVSVPVNLFPASRSGRVVMRLLDHHGNPVQRRYTCPQHERDIHPEHIVRGYEVGDGQYVIVQDEELEAAEPRKTRDIDLRRFVDRADIPAIYVGRVYYLTPRDSSKAYRLLAAVMAESDRAGIGTFVMRDKEHLVAIVSESGILRAETLRFHDELRSPTAVGLPKKKKPNRRLLTRFERAIQANQADELDPDELRDEYAEQLLKLVEEKRRKGEDVYAAEAEPGEPEDLFESIRKSLAVVKQRAASGNGRARPRRRRRRAAA